MSTWAKSTEIGTFLASAWGKVVGFVVAGGGPFLYCVMLVGNLVCAAFRWYLAYFVVSLLGLVLPCGAFAGAAGWIAAFAPLLWSVWALVSPGAGRFWAWGMGARRPSAEEEQALDDAFRLLRVAEPDLTLPSGRFVFDDPLPFSEVRGRGLVISRQLVESEWLVPALAHELGHINTFDSRFTEALVRLVLWDDPLSLPRGEYEVEGLGGGFVWGCARWFLRLAGGGLPQRILDVAWFWYWRQREFVADRFAASLGHGEGLAGYLAEQALAFDMSERRGLINWDTHPPVALRIERLRGAVGVEKGDSGKEEETSQPPPVDED